MEPQKLEELSIIERSKNDLDGLEQFFKDTLKKCIKYCINQELITDGEKISAEKMEKVPVALMMEHVLTLKDYIIPKHKQQDEHMLRFVTYTMIQNISPDQADNEDADLINTRLALKDKEVVFRVYRYFECSYRIADSYKKILMSCVSQRF
jgi:hypothetical protein